MSDNDNGVTVRIDPENVERIVVSKTDSRGRAAIGSEHANSEVKLAILDTTTDDTEQDDE